MAKNLVITTTLETWNDLISLNQKFLNKFVFREQADSAGAYTYISPGKFELIDKPKIGL